MVNDSGYKRIRKTKEEQQLINKQVQLKLEEAIIGYQNAINQEDHRSANKFYQDICDVYPPLDFVKVWYKKYKHFYDSREDFTQDYLYVFCKALMKWQPRDKRPESRYNGTGEFKNYFWSNLNNYYTNIVKFKAAGIRNIAVVCPICNKQTQTLSTHLLNHHPELLWEQLAVMGHDIEKLYKCPLCKSHKLPQVPDPVFDGMGDPDRILFLTQNSALRKHLLSKHSPLLFEKFNDSFPEHDTMNVKPSSNYFIDDSGDNEINVYDNVEYSDPVAKLWNTNLSDIQKQILELILISKNKKIIYQPDVYNCTMEEFEDHMDDLRVKLNICGLEG